MVTLSGLPFARPSTRSSQGRGVVRRVYVSPGVMVLRDLHPGRVVGVRWLRFRLGYRLPGDEANGGVIPIDWALKECPQLRAAHDCRPPYVHGIADDVVV